MAYEMLLQEAQGMSEAALMEVVRFMRFIKLEIQSEEAKNTTEPVNDKKDWIRKPGGMKGIVMADDFDAPLEDFEEYM